MRDIPIAELTGMPYLWLYLPHVWKLPTWKGMQRYMIGCTSPNGTTVVRKIYYDAHVAAQVAVAFAKELRE